MHEPPEKLPLHRLKWLQYFKKHCVWYRVSIVSLTRSYFLHFHHIDPTFNQTVCLAKPRRNIKKKNDSPCFFSLSVLSNAPHKYAVVEAQGSIKAHCCVDM